MRAKRASEAGLTLLELVLALSIGTVLITSFFVSYRALMQAISLTSNELNATSRVADLFETIVRDLEQANSGSITVPDGKTVTFAIGPVQYRYQLVTAGASQDAYVQKVVVASSTVTPVGPRHALANLHPFPGTLKDYNNGDVLGFNPVDLFTLDTGTGQIGAGRFPQVIMHGVIQINQDAPVRYVRGRATCRLQNP